MLLRGMLRGVLILPQTKPNILESQSLVCPRGRRLLIPFVLLRLSLVWVLLCQLPLLWPLGLWTLLLLLTWPRAKAFYAICAITSSMSCQILIPCYHQIQILLTLIMKLVAMLVMVIRKLLQIVKLIIMKVKKVLKETLVLNKVLVMLIEIAMLYLVYNLKRLIHMAVLY